ncbi:ester cyclase [Pseudonocardia sichuanensis]|uniref:SnoaL-like protein n=1 Tax=Pseudonocardia kunmingensis TaxID=630975 RepID=A0A543E220_9PSEU|nr:nuclear transport factor 2 family protein [Pseudonocardia kunmingensis]TQM15623.1 SnoaL-like protein [Pseudonocardia kunmingensis]
MEPEELYRRWIDELWAGRVERVSELVADAFVGHWPDHDVHGPAQLAETIRQTHAMLAPLSFAIEVGPFAHGGLVAGRWRGHGRQDGAETTFLGNDILRVEDGRFVEYWVGSMVVT